MSMHVHELHAAMVHAPLGLLPMAAGLDLGAALTGSRGRLASTLWWAGATSGLVAGLTGMASSQQVQADEPASEMMWLHGVGNVLVLGTAIGMAAYRTTHRPTVTSATLGLVACGVSLFTAYLGGEMVYGRGVGVRAMPRYTRAGVSDSPKVLSRAALPKLLRDAGAGLAWLVRRTARTLRGRARVSRETFGLGESPVGVSVH
jgi:uncharacterized membrane protein